MTDDNLLNIGFNIANPLHDLICKVSQEIRDNYGSDWYIDDQRYHLHYPLFLFKAPEDNFPKIINTTKSFAKEIKKTEVECIDLISNQSGLIMMIFNENDIIYKYHLRSLDLYNTFRNGLQRDKYNTKEKIKSFTVEEQQNINEFGHIYVKNLYKPHITIARISKIEDRDKIITKYKKIFVGQKSYINSLRVHSAIFGPHGKTILLADELIG